MIGLLGLPVETVELILKEVDALDIKSLCKSSRFIREISNNSKAVWVAQANNLVDRWVPVPLPKSNTLDACSISEVRDAVLRAAYLECNWSKPNPRLVSPIKESEFLEKIQDTVNVVSNYLAIIKRDRADRLMFCDMKDGSCLWEGVFECESGNRSVIYVDHCDMHWNDDGEMFQCFCLIRILEFEEGRGYLWWLKLCKADVPKTTQPSDTIIFREICPIPLQPEGRRQLDLNLNLLLNSHYVSDGGIAELHMEIHRWNTMEKKSVIFEDQIAETQVGRYREVVTCLPLRNAIFRRSIDLNKEIVTSVSLSPDPYSEMREASLPQTQAIYSFKSDLKIPEIAFFGAHFSEALFYYPWYSKTRQYDIRRPNALFSSYQYSAKPYWTTDDSSCQWFLVQYYWNADGPYGKRRCIIRRPSCKVINAGHVAANFRHATWVEEKFPSEVGTLSEKRNRQLMLATFPPPVVDTDEFTEESILEVEPVKLDVTAHILDTARDVFIAESEGVITIVNQKGQIYILRYA